MEAKMNDFNVLPANYVSVLLGMSNDTKLRVIRLLTDSLLKSDGISDNNKSCTQAMLKKHAGAWVENESTDD